MVAQTRSATRRLTKADTTTRLVRKLRETDEMLDAEGICFIQGPPESGKTTFAGHFSSYLTHLKQATVTHTLLPLPVTPTTIVIDDAQLLGEHEWNTIKFLKQEPAPHLRILLLGTSHSTRLDGYPVRGIEWLLLGLEEVRSVLGGDEERAEAVLRKTGGHPYLVALARAGERLELRELFVREPTELEMWCLRGRRWGDEVAVHWMVASGILKRG